MIDTLAVVGATGAVGRIIVSLLLEREFPARRIKLLASPRSAGKPMTVAGRSFAVDVLEPDAQADHALADAGGLARSSVRRPCVVLAGCVMMERTSPKLAAMLQTCVASMTEKASSRPRACARDTS